jgi:hypothetical protein
MGGTAKDGRAATGQHGLVHATFDAFVDSTRAVVEAVAAAGSGALGALPGPVPDTVARMLATMRRVVEQMPPLTAEIDIVVQEVHAKRLSIQALQAELAALDEQLALLERSLAPVQAWSAQWNRLRQSLTEALPPAR